MVFFFATAVVVFAEYGLPFEYLFKFSILAAGEWPKTKTELRKRIAGTSEEDRVI